MDLFMANVQFVNQLFSQFQYLFTQDLVLRKSIALVTLDSVELSSYKPQQNQKLVREVSMHFSFGKCSA